MCLCVVGAVCCAVVSLRRVVPSCVVVFVFGVVVVVVCCVFVSEVKFLDLLPLMFSLFNSGGDTNDDQVPLQFLP